MKASKKTKNTVKFIENPTKDTNKTLKGENVKNNSKKYITPYMNTISEIQVSDSDQSIDTEDNENDSMGWRSLPDMVTTSEDCDSSDTDWTEGLDDSFCEQTHILSIRLYGKSPPPPMGESRKNHWNTTPYTTFQHSKGSN